MFSNTHEICSSEFKNDNINTEMINHSIPILISPIRRMEFLKLIEIRQLTDWESECMQPLAARESKFLRKVLCQQYPSSCLGSNTLLRLTNYSASYCTQQCNNGPGVHAVSFAHHFCNHQSLVTVWLSSQPDNQSALDT